MKSLTTNAQKPNQGYYKLKLVSAGMGLARLGFAWLELGRNQLARLGAGGLAGISLVWLELLDSAETD